MKIKTALLGFTIAGVTALSASCSGSSESNDNSGGKSSTSTAGKSSSTAGASSAGASNNGGASSNGGTNGSNAGTSNNAGTNSNGGNANTAGTFNFGGAGIDPSDFMCDPVPTTGAACAAGTQPCTDGTNVCVCRQSKWACFDIGGGAAGAGPGGGLGQLECPATKPMSGGNCGDTFGVCPYGQGGCACYNGTWACN